jgi:hypothetical protein
VLGTLGVEAKDYAAAIRWWIVSSTTGRRASTCRQRAGRGGARLYVTRVLAQEPGNAAAQRLRDELR